MGNSFIAAVILQHRPTAVRVTNRYSVTADAPIAIKVFSNHSFFIQDKGPTGDHLVIDWKFDMLMVIP